MQKNLQKYVWLLCTMYNLFIVHKTENTHQNITKISQEKLIVSTTQLTIHSMETPVIPKITTNNPIFSPNFYECLLKVLPLTLSNIWKILNVVLSKSFWNLFRVSTIT